MSVLFTLNQNKQNVVKEIILTIIGDDNIEWVIMYYPYINNNNILEEIVVKAKKRKKPLQINIINTQNDSDWLPGLKNVRNLLNNSNENIYCHAYQSELEEFGHSKIFIACKSHREPLVLILGSSNFTNGAYGEATNKNKLSKQNIESDVVLYNNSYDNYEFKNIIESNKDFMITTDEEETRKVLFLYHDKMLDTYNPSQVIR